MGSATPETIAAVALAAFLSILVAIPLIYPYGYFTSLDGLPGGIDGSAPPGLDLLSAAAYALGDLLCHQQESRTIMINGSQMAFCMRDVAVMAGALAMLTLIAIRALRPDGRRAVAIALALSSATFIEWALEHAMGADFPAPRAASGLLTGMGLAMLFCLWVVRERRRASVALAPSA